MRIQEFDYSIDLLPVSLWQYNDAVNLNALITNEQAFIDDANAQFWQDWYDNVFNLITADDFGLSIWSIILDVPYLVRLSQASKPIFGYNQLPVVNDYVNYERGNYARGSSRIILSTEDQRIFLRIRYFQLISRGSIIDTNEFLNLLFDDPLGPYQGGAWVLDNLDMTMEYVFNTPISTGLLEALTVYDVLPRPAGVKLSYTVL